MRGLILIFFAIMLSGCATYTSTTEDMRNAWAAGNYSLAEKELEELSDSDDDRIIKALNLGAIQRAKGDIKSSLQTLDGVYNEIQLPIDTLNKATEGVASIALNDTYTKYTGTHYDRVMLATYQVLNSAEVGDLERTAVEIRRLANFQQDAIDINAKLIAADKARLEEYRKKLGIPECVSAEYQDQIKQLTAAKAPRFTNPFSYWISGVIYSHIAQDTSDREYAVSLFRLAREALGGPSYVVDSDFLTANTVASNGLRGFGDVTYIIYETGSAPIKRQHKFDLPLYLVNKYIPHVSINLPYLEEQASYAQYLDVEVGNKKLNLETLVNFDALVQEEFQAQMPNILLRSVIRTTAKSLAEFAAAQASGEYALYTHAAFSIYQLLTNDADLRIWSLLPKQIKVGKCLTPDSGRIIVAGREVRLNKRGINFVFVKRTSISSPVYIRTLTLTK